MFAILGWACIALCLSTAAVLLLVWHWDRRLASEWSEREERDRQRKIAAALKNGVAER